MLEERADPATGRRRDGKQRDHPSIYEIIQQWVGLERALRALIGSARKNRDPLVPVLVEAADMLSLVEDPLQEYRVIKEAEDEGVQVRPLYRG